MKIVIKETPRVIIWRDINTGMVNYQFKITDKNRIIEAV